MWEWLLGPKQKSPDSYVVSPFTNSHMIHNELEGLNKSLNDANKVFTEGYLSAAALYKRSNFEDAYFAALLSNRELISKCEHHIERTRDLFFMSMHSGSKPFGSYDIFYHLFDPVQSLTRGLLLAITCLTRMREYGTKGDFPELIRSAERFEKLVKAIVYHDKDYRKGDKREDVNKMSKFIDVIKSDTNEILKLAKKANNNKLKLEELQKAKVVNRE